MDLGSTRTGQPAPKLLAENHPDEGFKIRAAERESILEWA